VSDDGGLTASREGQFVVPSRCEPPTDPSELTSAVDGRTVILQWRPPVGGGAIAGYVIEAGSQPGGSDLLRASVGLVTRLTGLAPPGRYYVRVRAVSPCGSSDPSNERLVTIP
jgi:hypothetical protein